jgi:hypothetical protein
MGRLRECTCPRTLVLGVLAALRTRSLAPLFWCCSLLAAPLTFVAKLLDLALNEVRLPTRAAKQLVNNHRLPFYNKGSVVLNGSRRGEDGTSAMMEAERDGQAARAPRGVVGNCLWCELCPAHQTSVSRQQQREAGEQRSRPFTSELFHNTCMKSVQNDIHMLHDVLEDRDQREQLGAMVWFYPIEIEFL